MAIATPSVPDNPYTPAEYIEYPKPEVPYCWTPEYVVNVQDNPPVDPEAPNQIKQLIFVEKF